MTNLIERTLQRLGEQRSCRLSRPGDERYAAATAQLAGVNLTLIR
jgi:hypothetical protein